MEESWLVKDISHCSATDSVIVVITNKRLRKEIINNLCRLGDRIVDYFDQTQLYSVSDFFGIPHRLMVMSYRDYKNNAQSIIKHLASSEAFDIPPILIFGRKWRKIPVHPKVIDGDNVTPVYLLKLYWEARGQTVNISDGILLC